MTNPFSRDANSFDRFFIGFDDVFRHIASLHDGFARNTDDYPPYNISKLDDTWYLIDTDVAGFSKRDITIEHTADTLTVRGRCPQDTINYLHNGIGKRDFTRKFYLSNRMQVRSAGLVDGMLRITLERVVPPLAKPRKIEIVDDNYQFQQFLQE